jgi:hypothetical protein
VAMPKSNWLPTVVPYGADQTVYLVFDSFGASRSDCPEKESVAWPADRPAYRRVPHAARLG